VIDRVTDVHLGSFAQRRRPGNAVLLSQNGFKKNFKREQSTGLRYHKLNISYFVRRTGAGIHYIDALCSRERQDGKCFKHNRLFYW
jgi:hypothetical protein